MALDLTFLRRTRGNTGRNVKSATLAAKEGIGYFFSTIDGIKHHMVNVVESNGLTFLEANVEYQRKDGKTVTIPAVTVLERNGDLVKSLRIYFDVAPVYT